METIIVDQDCSISDFGKIEVNFYFPEKKRNVLSHLAAVSFSTNRYLIFSILIRHIYKNHNYSFSWLALMTAGKIFPCESFLLSASVIQDVIRNSFG